MFNEKTNKINQICLPNLGLFFCSTVIYYLDFFQKYWNDKTYNLVVREEEIQLVKEEDI